jgi:hypothetical protein
VTLAGPSRDGGPSAIIRQGPSESVSLRGDRATASVEGICCEKIRGCSCRVSSVFYSMSAVPMQKFCLLNLTQTGERYDLTSS